MQHILVCARDSVLAKKIRFLLAKDECEVEILDQSSQLEPQLRRGSVSLLILSRDLDGEDAVERLARFDPSVSLPPTLILGGPRTITADFIRLIPDPVDTQAIYREASDILAQEATRTHSDTDETIVALEIPASRKAHQDGGATDVFSPASISEREAFAEHDEELHFSDVVGLDEIAGRLDQLESDHLNEHLSDAFDIDEASGLHPAMSSPPTPPAHLKRPPVPAEPPVSGGLLEPARFAKVLYQCWAKGVSGALVVARDHETLTVHFERGAPIHVESSIPGDQLGRALVTRGRISEAQYGDAAKRAIERGLRLGQALVELGFFSDAELGKELANHAREQVVGCFDARQGAFEFDAKRRAPGEERPYRLDVAHVIAEGLRRHADEGVLLGIVGSVELRYFRLKKPLEELRRVYPLSDSDAAFLEYGGRAYNVSDASELSAVSRHHAYGVLALLTVCEELDDFTPGVAEFEARIREERLRAKELESRVSSVLPTRISEPPTPLRREEPPPPLRKEEPPPSLRREEPPPPLRREELPGRRDVLPPPPAWQEPPRPLSPPPLAVAPPFPSSSKSAPLPVTESKAPPPPPPPPPAAPAPSSNFSSGPVTTGSIASDDIPPMPVPAPGESGMTPRPLVYAKPLPRNADGTLAETSERALSREHFQRGVSLLGQGSFSAAEEAFRDAVALCADEHVYLIGLARAIYYNPAYEGAGKVPVLRSVVGRATQLAPEDKRVATLRSWVDHAEVLLSV